MKRVAATLAVVLCGSTVLVGQDYYRSLISLLAGSTVNAPGIAATSTDGLTLRNTTVSTAAIPVQMPPRLCFDGHVWNTTVTAIDNTSRWCIDSLPISGATPSGLLRFGSSLNGAAFTFPMTIASTGSLTLATPGSFISGADVQLPATGSTGFLYWTGRTAIGSLANGTLNVTTNNAAIGSQLKVDALPTVSACGAGAPAVTAGSTPLSGSVTVGTGGPATCAITFNGTAYPSAPHCSGSVETVTAANARAMGYSATTTVLTIVPAAAWADSSVVNWTCVSAK
jgi:hypothetical protein